MAGRDADRRVAAKLAEACRETAAEAIAATLASGQASTVYHNRGKFASRKEAQAAKIAAAKAKREAKEGKA
ncbi:hypothetical protein SPRG_00336 [Saprolegnia parasitica CBS 223.65]|uniref:Uncharacterized protein n=1 Tax=Saprolegnia parasitica (strain CBS 223.65) TaxID=695850 RepID=A0A067CXQ1_SAPPC|nr:hypothetical protein SPRG_00336 [Saprolegnia parasitica CBS 223.65]KDO35489.1 hypothetical protein SPRG_00336 [Saprolegnia parasitica CBS 223.65]|eukprot:XP_012193826.1 hypothetical protein SPRG_00336 [Saprolegnia parasitica CBS 223.65]